MPFRVLRIPAGPGRGGSPPERHEIEDRFKWKLDLIYPTWEDWEKTFASVEKTLPKLAGLQGTLASSGAALLDAIETIHTAQRDLEKAMVFAGMKSDEDTRIGENTARKGRITSLAVQFSEAVSWFDSELLAIEPQQLEKMIQDEPGLEIFRHYFEDSQRLREHTLSVEQEALLAAAGLMAQGASQVFNALDNADLEYGEILDSDDQPVTLTKARYFKLTRSPDRRVRQDAYTSFLNAYAGVKNTMAANLDAKVKNHVFYARARKYNGTLEASLYPDAVPNEVYHALLQTIEDHLPVIHRFTALKKRVLEVDPLREFDLAVPLFRDGEVKFDFDGACKLALAAFAPLGEDYVETVRQGMDQGWIDVHESAGKRSGGYSNGVYDTPPFILLNWAGELEDTFTLAHELGHSMHSWLTVNNQPYVYGNYPIFTAEVASTCNELLLMDHLLKQCPNQREKLYLLDYHLSQINNTVFRQAMFAEFEYRIHLLGEQGQTLTADSLNELYLEMLKKYWGPVVQFDPQLSPLTWSRIPHFYYNFYVYQYATAYSAAVALSRKVLTGDPAARESYLDILRSGCSRYPVDTILLGGVDMTTSGPMEDVIALFGSLIDQVEELLA